MVARVQLGYLTATRHHALQDLDRAKLLLGQRNIAEDIHELKKCVAMVLAGRCVWYNIHLSTTTTQPCTGKKKAGPANATT